VDKGVVRRATGGLPSGKGKEPNFFEKKKKAEKEGGVRGGKGTWKRFHEGFLDPWEVRTKAGEGGGDIREQLESDPAKIRFQCRYPGKGWADSRGLG